MRLNKKVFKSNNFKNEYIDHSGFLHTSIRSYSVNHKIIKFSVYNELTYIALANWIIEDGTDSYSIKDVVMLINILIIKYDIRYYSFPRIYVYKRYMPKLRSIVEPFVHISMMYKLGKKRELTEWFKVISLKLIWLKNHIRSNRIFSVIKE